jgi:nickel transport protein
MARRLKERAIMRTSGKAREVRYITRSKLIPAVSLIVLLLCSSTPAFAHKVYLYAWVEGNTVYTESYFSGGVKVDNGLIQVFDPAGKKLLEGHTNTKGEFSFTIPEKADLRIVINAGMGHRGEYILKADDLGGTPASETGKEPAMDVTKTESPSPVQVNADEIRKIVEKSLDSRLRPIARSIARLQEEKGPGLTEIVGGIGYIFGTMGLLLYFKERKKKKK